MAKRLRKYTGPGIIFLIGLALNIGGWRIQWLAVTLLSLAVLWALIAYLTGQPKVLRLYRTLRLNIMRSRYLNGLVERIENLSIQRRLRTFGYTPAPEHIWADLDISIQAIRSFQNSDTEECVLLVQAMIVNRSSKHISINAWLHYEFRLEEGRKAWGIPIMPYNPPGALVERWVAELEKKFNTSFGRYLKFPLNIDPDAALEGYMVFAKHSPELTQFLEDPRFVPFQNKELFLEYFDLVTQSKYRMSVHSINR